MFFLTDSPVLCTLKLPCIVNARRLANIKQKSNSFQNCVWKSSIVLKFSIIPKKMKASGIWARLLLDSSGRHWAQCACLECYRPKELHFLYQMNRILWLFPLIFSIFWIEVNWLERAFFQLQRKVWFALYRPKCTYFCPQVPQMIIISIPWLTRSTLCYGVMCLCIYSFILPLRVQVPEKQGICHSSVLWMPSWEPDT